MKVVINTCYGGFDLSEVAMRRYAELIGIDLVVESESGYESFKHYYVGSKSDENYFNVRDIGRADPLLVQVVEELGEACNTQVSELKIVDIPDNVAWHIADYDGLEHVAEDHRTWS